VAGLRRERNRRSRTRTRTTEARDNRNAALPVNAILNYSYPALESEIRIKAISDGYDPTIGIMHEGNDGSSKFIFDLMEPERPKVDLFPQTHIVEVSGRGMALHRGPA
jgi:CRISPR-associated protein Cas1